MPTKKYERNYLANLTTANARIWFRYRSQIISDIKGNQSTQWTGRMHCRHCNTGSDERQEHIEKCTGFTKEGEKLKLDDGDGTRWTGALDIATLAQLSGELKLWPLLVKQLQHVQDQLAVALEDEDAVVPEELQPLQVHVERVLKSRHQKLKEIVQGNVTVITTVRWTQRTSIHLFYDVISPLNSGAISNNLQSFKNSFDLCWRIVFPLQLLLDGR